MYGHYDVQPPDPLDKWISPPFEPVRREGNIVARGATDDKGQVLTHIKSAEAWIKTRGSLPINLKYIIEGEEEVGSQGLEQFIAAHADRLACDCIVISDGGKFSAESPPLPTRCAASPTTSCVSGVPTATCTRAASAAR